MSWIFRFAGRISSPQKAKTNLARNLTAEARMPVGSRESGALAAIPTVPDFNQTASHPAICASRASERFHQLADNQSHMYPSPGWGVSADAKPTQVGRVLREELPSLGLGMSGQPSRPQ